MIDILDIHGLTDDISVHYLTGDIPYMNLFLDNLFDFCIICTNVLAIDLMNEDISWMKT